MVWGMESTIHYSNLKLKHHPNAQVKRIFHWNQAEGRWDVVKVNDADGWHYETNADVRLNAGLVNNLP